MRVAGATAVLAACGQPADGGVIGVKWWEEPALVETDAERIRELFADTTTVPRIVERFRAICREHGYALAGHGSKARDLDLIAVPWTDEATDAATLVGSLAKIEGVRLKDKSADPSKPFPRVRPHGRLGWVFLFVNAQPGWPRYIDLSVMPRKSA